MRIELIGLSEDNMQQCFNLKVACDQMQYIASNEESWKAAKENEKVARPFAVYCDEKMIGFTMFAFDEDYEDPDDRYWLWRLMIDESFREKGTELLRYRVSFSILKIMVQTIFDYQQKTPIRMHYLYIIRQDLEIQER